MNLKNIKKKGSIAVYCFMFLCIPVLGVLADQKEGYIVLTKEKIDSYNAGNIQDVLNQISGVYAGDSSVSIRGSSKVRVFLDGRTINDPTSSHGGVKWELVPIKRVSKIKIIKGSGGVAYGDDASGGVILITSKQINNFSGQIQSHLGNYKTQYYFANVEQKQGHVGVGLSAGYDVTDGFRPNDDEDKRQFEAYSKYQFNPEAKIGFSFINLSEEQGYPGLPDYPTLNSRNHYRLSNAILSGEIGQIKNKLEFTDAYKSNSDIDKQLDTFLSIKKINDQLTKNINSDFFDTLSVGGGIEYAKADASQFEEQEESKYWIYGNASYTLSGVPITFLAGVRGIYHTEFDEYFNPEAKIRYEKDKYSIQLSVTHTHNTPSFYQRFYQSSSTFPNPNLSVEKANNFSLSFAVNISPSLKFQISPFYNILKDRITYVRGAEDTGRYENFGKVSYKGFDLAINWKLLENTSFKTTYTYLEAKDEETDLWLSVKSKHKLACDLLCKPIDNLSVRFSVKYTSRAYTKSDNTESAPEYTVAHIRGEYKIHSFYIYSELKNIADKYYLYGDGYPGPPRTWIAGIRYQF